MSTHRPASSMHGTTTPQSMIALPARPSMLRSFDDPPSPEQCFEKQSWSQQGHAQAASSFIEEPRSPRTTRTWPRRFAGSSGSASGTSLDTVFPTRFASRPPSPFMDMPSDSDMSNRYSSADSFDLAVLATPGSPSPHCSGVLSMPTVPEVSFLSDLDTVSRPNSMDSYRSSDSAPSPVWAPSSMRVVRGPSPCETASAPASPIPRRTSSRAASAALSSSQSSSHPSIRVTESTRGAPQLSFINGKESLLGPPLLNIVVADRATSPSGDSFATVTGATPLSSPRTPISTNSTRSSPSEPTPVSRRRRLNALRSLVAHLDFAQPWSVIERPEPEDGEAFWPYSGNPPPQLNRLSLGNAFDADGMSGNESTISLPQLSPSILPTVSPLQPRSPGVLRSRRYSRSMTSLVQNTTVEAAYAKSRAPLPPVTTPAVPPTKESRLELPSVQLRRKSSGIKRQPSIRPISTTREAPRPRQRRESFGVVYSGYSKSIKPTSPLPQNQPTSWRASLANDLIYERVADGMDGEREVKRQEIIWEMCETEVAFVRSCRDVIRLFAAPLRDAQGEWMQGLPDKVCKLFESLEDIHTTHSSISTKQDIARRSTGVVDVEEFIEQLRAWVPRLVCHERYLMLFDTVVHQIDEAVRDETNIFGEFLRLQTRDSALGSMSLGSMLLKPVQRLTKYTLFHRRLLAETPAPHPLHTRLLDLIDATETIIGRLEACKAREDDFNQLTALEGCLDGLPEGFRLAVRGRRLVAHAQVIRVANDSGTFSTRASSLRALRATLSTVASVRGPSPPSSIYALSRTTSRSPTQTDLSLPTIWPNSDASGCSSVAPSLRSLSGSETPKHRERTVSHSTSYSSLAEAARPPMKITSLLKVRREDLLVLLVFNDMVLLATSSERPVLFRSRRAGAVRLRVLPVNEGGLGTVDDVQELTGTGVNAAFALATTSPDGTPTVMTYAMAPASDPRVQKSSILPGPGVETIEHVIGAIAMARQDRQEMVYDEKKE